MTKVEEIRGNPFLERSMRWFTMGSAPDKSVGSSRVECGFYTLYKYRCSLINWCLAVSTGDFGPSPGNLEVVRVHQPQ